MTVHVRQTWESLGRRTRIVIAVTAALLIAAAYTAFLYSASTARTQLRKSVTELRVQASQLELRALEVQRLLALPRPPVSQRDLRSVIDAEARAAGLSQALIRVKAPASEQVQVVLGSIPFVDWVAWVASLQSQQIRLDSCRIEALSVPGYVSAKATFVRAR